MHDRAMSFRHVRPRHVCPALFLLLASCTGKEAAPGTVDPAAHPKAPPVHAPFGEPEEDAPWPLSAEAEENAKVG